MSENHSRSGKAKKLLVLLLAAAMAISLCLPAAALPGAKKAEPEDASRYVEHKGFYRPVHYGMKEMDPKVITPPSPDGDFTFMRVLISTGKYATHTDLDLCSDYYLTNGVHLSGTAAQPHPIRVVANASSVTLIDLATDEEVVTAPSIELKRVNVNYTAGWAKLTYSENSMSLNKMYLGDFRFYSDSGVIRMVNRLHMVYYIYGVVGYELSETCPAETLRVMALASKSHALYFIDSHADYDEEDGWESLLYQGYRGFNMSKIATLPFCCEAIGKAMTCNNSFKPIYWTNSNGGETALPSIVFGSGLSIVDEGYDGRLDELEFEYELNVSEFINFTEDGGCDNSRFLDFVLLKIRQQEGVDTNEVVSIDEVYTYEPFPGTVRDMRKLHVTATVKVPGEPIVDPEDPEAEPEETFVDETYSFECASFDLKNVNLTDIDGSGDSYSGYKHVFKRNMYLIWGRETEDGGYKLIYSRHGHGIGLSASGAIVMAKNYGWLYTDIIGFYFPGFDIVDVLEDDPNDTDPTVIMYEVLAYGVCRTEGAELLGGVSDLYPYPCIGHVGLGEHVDILGVTDSCWYWVFWNGCEGYLKFEDVQLTMFPSPHNGVFTLVDGETKSNANLRSEPGIRSGNVIVYLSKNTHFTAWTHIGKWYYIKTENGYEGFISSVVVNFSEPYEYTGQASLMIKQYPLGWLLWKQAIYNKPPSYRTAP